MSATDNFTLACGTLAILSPMLLAFMTAETVRLRREWAR